MAVVVAGVVVTVGASEVDMVGAIALHQLLLQSKTSPSSRRSVRSEAPTA